MKKIVHIIIGLEVGGAELMLKRLVLHSQKKGLYQHIVISLTDIGVIGKDLQQQGITVYSLGMHSLLSVPQTFFKLKKCLRSLAPDTVQTWMYHADFLGGLAAKSVGVKNIIWGIRTTDVSQGASKLTVYLSKLCAKLSYSVPNTIVCAAKASKDYHISIGYDAAKMRVIPNGFDIEALYATDEDGHAIRQQIGLSADDIVIGSIGRFNPVKNQKLFIEVADLLIKNNPNLPLKFLMVGRDNTADNHELMSWLSAHDLTNHFTLLGQRDDVAKCMKAMDMVCLHSKTEGFPNIVVEAMILQTFVVSTDVGEVSTLIPKDQITSLDKFDYTSKVQEFLDNGYFLNQQHLSDLKDSSIAKYSMSTVVLQYEGVYEKH